MDLLVRVSSGRPPSPSNISTVPGNNSIIVSWDKVRSFGVKTYTIIPYIGLVAQQSITVLASISSISFTAINGTGYAFSIIANSLYGSSWPSPLSDVVTPTTGALTLGTLPVDTTGIDISSSLNAIVVGFPDGTLGSPTIIDLGTDKTYLVENTWTIKDRNHLHFIGTRVKFRRKTLGTRTTAHIYVDGGSDIQFNCVDCTISGSNDYAGSGKGTSRIQTVVVNATGGTYTATYRNQTTAPITATATSAQLKAAFGNFPMTSLVVIGGPGNSGGTSPYILTFIPPPVAPGAALDQITFDTSLLTGGTQSVTSTITTNGTPDAYWAAYEAQNAFEHHGVNGYKVIGWNIEKIWGDGYYSRKYPRASLCLDGEIANFIIRSTGRQGFTVMGNRGLYIHDGEIQNVRRSFWDMEDIDAEVSGFLAENIVLGFCQLNFFSAWGGDHTGRVLDTKFKNITSSKAFQIQYQGDATHHRGPLTLDTLTYVGSNPYGNPLGMCMQILYCDGVHVHNVTQDLQSGRTPAMVLADLTNCTDYDIGPDNDLGGSFLQARYR